MIDFKTTQKVDFPAINRKVINDFLYVRVLMPTLGKYKVVPNGYYYYIDENNNEVILEDFSTQILWQDVDAVEANLQPLEGLGIYEAMLLRVEEMTLIRIDQEYAENNENNWGINSQMLEKI